MEKFKNTSVLQCKEDLENRHERTYGSECFIKNVACNVTKKSVKDNGVKADSAVIQS